MCAPPFRVDRRPLVERLISHAVPVTPPGRKRAIRVWPSSSPDIVHVMDFYGVRDAHPAGSLASSHRRPRFGAATVVNDCLTPSRNKAAQFDVRRQNRESGRGWPSFLRISELKAVGARRSARVPSYRVIQGQSRQSAGTAWRLSVK